MNREFDMWLLAAIKATRDPETTAAINARKSERARVPLDVLFARWPHRPEVEARIRRLNPSGVDEGSRVRGYEPHRRISNLSQDVIGPKAFIARFGREAYRAVPREAFYRQGHRKAITGRWVKQNMARASA